MFNIDPKQIPTSWLALVAVLVLILAAGVFIYVVNGLAYAGGSAFVLEHTVHNYILAILFLVLVKGKWHLK